MVTDVMLQEICPGAGGLKTGDFVEERSGGPSRTTVDGTTSSPVIRAFLTASMKYRITPKYQNNAQSYAGDIGHNLLLLLPSGFQDEFLQNIRSHS